MKLKALPGVLEVNESRGGRGGAGRGANGISSTTPSTPALRETDQAKWAEGKAIMGTIATALRAYNAERGTDGPKPTAIIGTGPTQLGFTSEDLRGKYFLPGDFSMAVTSMNPLTFTITCTPIGENRPTNPRTMTLNQNNVWTP